MIANIPHTVHPAPREYTRISDMEFRNLAAAARLAAEGDSNDDELDALRDALDAAELMILGGWVTVELEDED